MSQVALYVSWRTAMMPIASCNFFHPGCYTQELAAYHQEQYASGYYVAYWTKEYALTDIDASGPCSGCWRPIAEEPK